MSRGAYRWSRYVAIALAATLAFHALHFYGTRFFDSIHSDSAIPIMLAMRMLAGGTLLPRDWYYVNGDVWLLGSHVYALLPIKLLGIGPVTLLVVLVFGYLLEVAALLWAYGKLASDRYGAVLATSVTLIAWSWMHIVFVYSDLGYGYYATLYALIFSLHAVVLARAFEGRWAGGLIALGVLLLVIVGFQNPSRGFVFVIAPLLAGCFWPYRDAPRRPRMLLAGGVFGLLAISFVVFRFGLQRVMTFSTPSGHNAFAFRDVAGVLSNVKTLAQGSLVMMGGGGTLLRSIPGLSMTLVALGFVVREVVSSRAWSPLRFVCVAALSQLGLILAPVILGNLVVNDASIRYLMPNVLLVFGLGAVVVMRDVATASKVWPRRIAGGWLGVSVVAAVIATLEIAPIRGLESETGQWAHRRSHYDLAAALEARGLQHGFSTYWNANLLTLLSHGKAKTCPVHLAGGGLVPYRWNTDVGCFDAARLPDRIFVVNLAEERADAERAVAATFSEPIERFSVSDTFDVRVYRTSDQPLRWLELPLPEGDKLRFPLRITADHPQIGRGNVTSSGTTLVASGADGNLVHGPYLTLPKGRFSVRWIGERLGPEGGLHFDVACDSGNRVIAASDVPMDTLGAGAHRELARLRLELANTTREVEFRAYSAGGARVALEEVVVEAE